MRSIGPEFVNPPCCCYDDPPTSYVHGDSRTAKECEAEKGTAYETRAERESFRRGWILGYTQGQYNMRRTIMRKIADSGLPAITLLIALRTWLHEWPKKRRKVSP